MNSAIPNSPSGYTRTGNEGQNRILTEPQSVNRSQLRGAAFYEGKRREERAKRGGRRREGMGKARGNLGQPALKDLINATTDDNG